MTLVYFFQGFAFHSIPLYLQLLAVNYFRKNSIIDVSFDPWTVLRIENCAPELYCLSVQVRFTSLNLHRCLRFYYKGETKYTIVDVCCKNIKRVHEHFKISTLYWQLRNVDTKSVFDFETTLIKLYLNVVPTRSQS